MTSAPRPRALVFDVMGTVVDDVGGVRDATVAVLTRRGDGEDVALAVAAATSERLTGLMADVSDGRRPWSSHRALRTEAVRAAVAAAGVAPLDDAAEAELTSVVERFDPWPDSAAALGRLRKTLPVVALTNADPDEVAAFSQHAGLAWHLALSTRPSGTFKPDPRAYAVAVEALAVDPAELMMVAAHDWDLREAAELGFRTCYVRRPFQSEPPEGGFDLVVDDLHDLADRLGAARP